MRYYIVVMFHDVSYAYARCFSDGSHSKLEWFYMPENYHNSVYEMSTLPTLNVTELYIIRINS